MDRYVLVVLINVEPKKPISFSGIDTAKKVHDKLKELSTCTSGISPFPACSLSGSPGSQKWHFAIQALCVPTLYCSTEWEEVSVQHSDNEEPVVSAVDSCVSALQDQEHSQQSETLSHAELFEDAAEALHQLADKLPPPGRFLLDVIMLCVDEVGLKDFLPVMGSLKHMQAWHSARITIVTEHSAGWQMAASYLSGRVCSPSWVQDCIDERELWRGGLLVRERKFVSELLFEGFSLKAQAGADWSRELCSGSEPCCAADRTARAETFHYYQPALELIQLVRVTDLPVLLRSSTQLELTLFSRSAKGQMLMDQLRALRGEVGALFCLSCVVSSEMFPPAPQLSTAKWRIFVATRPKGLSAPEVEVKGEKGYYLLLVQGAETGGLKARLLHSANQINGAAALAVVNSLILIRGKVPSSSGIDTADWLSSLPRLRGDQLLLRERRLASMQAKVLQECLRRRAESHGPAALPPNDLRALLRLAREQYLKMHGATLPRASTRVPLEEGNRISVTSSTKHGPPSDWPERSALRNYANLQKGRQRTRSTLFSGNSGECLMGPKGSQRNSSALMDAREVLRHFTPDGLPSGELQPLPVLRGENAFQLSRDLTPRKVTNLPFQQATSAHYHGIEFCLDERKALERDRDFVRLQSRLIRFETQTTCCKEPCPVTLALSPMPSPAGLAEPDSVPNDEALQSEPLCRKHRTRGPDAHAHQHKRLAKSESGESLGSQGSAGSGRHPATTALRLQRGRSQSAGGPVGRSVDRPARGQPAGLNPTQGQRESRSQKHNRMLKEVVAKTLQHYGITTKHECFHACSQRLFDVSKLYLKDLKTSRGLHEEMRKAAHRNAQQVIDWVVEKASKNDV
ncbi:mdm2-binding protein isoform X2 [Electrophorus electricus]|uniref:mdm2-binding protein isoform X2 n=1 Tax=Electrophorus electricus TaxID=8005 RepID=UPI0015CFEAF5|nr:mdm2-binding protein isoform X2 [Electrophorus electricus]